MSLLTALAVACALAAGCGKRESQEIPAVSVQVYTTRGRIVQLPVQGRPATMLQIEHEHIPNFRDKTGEITVHRDGSLGMKRMIMPFPVAAGVSLDEFELEHKVEFTFEVNWGGSPTYQVTAIRRIPDDTVLFESPE